MASWARGPRCMSKATFTLQMGYSSWTYTRTTPTGGPSRVVAFLFSGLRTPMALVLDQKGKGVSRATCIHAFNMGA